MITCEQIRSSRELLGWPQYKLARQAGVSTSAVRKAETAGYVFVSVEIVTIIVRALEAAGIEFTDGERPGVRLKKD